MLLESSVGVVIEESGLCLAGRDFLLGAFRSARQRAAYSGANPPRTEVIRIELIYGKQFAEMIVARGLGTKEFTV
jgi:hypothetical protein